MATFGYLTHAATQENSLTPRGSKFTAPESGTVSKLTVYVKQYFGGTAKVVAAIYSDNAGVPDTKLAESSEGTVTASDSEVDCPISCAMTSGLVYWLMLWADSVNWDAAYDAGTTHQSSNDNAPLGYPTWRSSWSETFPLDRVYSIYATYTPSGAGFTVIGRSVLDDD